MQLRIGTHSADVIVDGRDIYGSGVNLAARLGTLAGPGEIVASTAVRDQLVAGLDAEVEDLGDWYLKHLNEPVRAYRLSPVGDHAVPAPVARAPQPLVPTIAVIPFEGRDVSPSQHVMGEPIADSVIASLSISGALRVISRLSTSALAGRAHALDEAVAKRRVVRRQRQFSHCRQADDRAGGVGRRAHARRVVGRATGSDGR